MIVTWSGIMSDASIRRKSDLLPLKLRWANA
jgi:hypothetical protein